MSVITAESRAEAEVVQQPRGKARFWEREAPLAYIFMIPGLVLLLLFMAYPFFLGIYLSMTDKMVGFADFNFVWFENFQLLLRDQIFHRTVANTLIYSFITVPFKLFLGLGLALVLNQTFHFSRFIRAGLLLPFIVPTAISSLAWLMLFDSVLSPISWVLKSWGMIQTNINFLGDRWNAIASVCVANIWRGLPFFAISILAGLQAVSPELARGRGTGWRQCLSAVPIGDPADDPHHPSDHYPLLHHLHVLRFSAHLRPDEGWSGKLHPHLRHLCLSDDELFRPGAGGGGCAFHVPLPGAFRRDSAALHPRG